MLERRPVPSTTFSLLSPLIAIALTVLVGFGLMAALGQDPAVAMRTYFVSPFLDPYTRAELVVKAIPLAIMGASLSERAFSTLVPRANMCWAQFLRLASRCLHHRGR